MTRFRSISYAPESIRHSRRPRAASVQRGDWTLCRNRQEFPIPDNGVLRRWTEQGCVRPDDYLVNHQLDVCVQARDVAEVDAVFRKSTARALGRIGRGLAFGALAVLWLTPVLGSVMFLSAVCAAVLSVRTVSRQQSYLLYTTGAHSAARCPGLLSS